MTDVPPPLTNEQQKRLEGCKAPIRGIAYPMTFDAALARLDYLESVVAELEKGCPVCFRGDNVVAALTEQGDTDG